MTRVFAVQQPVGRMGRRTMDLSPAEEWGRLEFLLGPSANPHANPRALARQVEDAMDRLGFCERDLVLLVGNPCLIGIVAAAAAQRTGGRLRMLQWSGRNTKYNLVEAQLKGFAPGEGRG